MGLFDNLIKLNPDRVIWRNVKITSIVNCECLKNSDTRAHLDTCVISGVCQCGPCKAEREGKLDPFLKDVMSNFIQTSIKKIENDIMSVISSLPFTIESFDTHIWMGQSAFAFLKAKIAETTEVGYKKPESSLVAVQIIVDNWMPEWEVAIGRVKMANGLPERVISKRYQFRISSSDAKPSC